MKAILDNIPRISASSWHQIEHAALVAARSPMNDQPIAVEVAGYLGSAVGVGEAARRYVHALRRAGAEVRARDVPLPGRDRIEALPSGGSSCTDAPIHFEIVCLNPEQLIPYLDEREPPRERRRTIGVWSWEVDVLPSGWREASLRLDEIWTYSDFAARMISRGVGAPVHSVPLPVSPPALGETFAAARTLPEGFRVLVMFDYLSTLERKNPLGAIEAYKRAFSPHEGSVLVVKSVNGQHRRQQQAQIAAAAAGRPDIVLLDGTVSAAQRDALLCECDCLLSLHRSEGYGLPLVEAMAIGKPVLATGFGGNMEFMDAHSSYPVAWTRVLVGEGVEHYPSLATWAEPDIDHAAHLLRAARYDAGSARERAERARREVERRLAPCVIGTQMIERLRALGAPRQRSRSGALATRLRILGHAHR